MRRWVADGLGGVVLFSWNVRDAEQVAALASALRSERPELLVSTDEEGGDVTRLEAAHGSSYPGNLALGVVDDVALTESVAAAIGSDLAAAGVNLDFAPVADVNTNPRNPIIGVRSFGSDPELVARHVAAFVRGLQRCGVAACARSTSRATATPSRIPTSSCRLLRAIWRRRSSRSARRSRPACQAMMTAPHHRFRRRRRAGDDQPATAHGRAARRARLRRPGDDGRARDAWPCDTVGVEQGAVLALAAGADALCLGHDLGDEAVGAVCRAVVDAVESGRLAEERLAEAAGRVARVSEWASRAAPLPGVDRAAGLEGARRALRVEGDVALAGPAVVVELLHEPNIAAGPTGHSLAELLGVEAVAAGEAVAQASGRRVVVVLRDAHRYESGRETRRSGCSQRCPTRSWSRPGCPRGDRPPPAISQRTAPAAPVSKPRPTSSAPADSSPAQAGQALLNPARCPADE